MLSCLGRTRGGPVLAVEAGLGGAAKAEEAEVLLSAKAAEKGWAPVNGVDGPLAV